MRGDVVTRELPPLVSEQQILFAGVEEIMARLPPGWTVDVDSDVARGRFNLGAIVTITAPNGQRSLLCAEVKRSLVTRDLASIVEQLNIMADVLSVEGNGGAAPLLIGRYLSAPIREWLVARGVSYVDATGNVRILLDSPALFLRDTGAERDPWRGPGRPKGNLKGRSAARVIRALADFCPPYSVPDLMKRANAPSGNTYRVVEFIEQQDLLTRREDGVITDVRWRPLIERWSKDYGFTSLRGVSSYLAPRGLPDLMETLATIPESDSPFSYAVTGSVATSQWEAYSPARNAMIYADVPERLAAYADLRLVDAGANVLVAPSQETAAFDRTQRLGGAVIVAPSQAAVDLLSSPGRGPEEGRALLDWMERNEPAWRE